MVLRHRNIVLGLSIFIVTFWSRAVLSQLNVPVSTSPSTIDSHLHTGWSSPDTSEISRFSIAPGINTLSTSNGNGFFPDFTSPFISSPTTGTRSLSFGGQGREGFFSSEARVELPLVLPLRGYTSLSFRTCSYGAFLYQEGESSDSLKMELNENGHLVLTVTQSGQSSTSSINDLKLNDNRWHRIFLRYEVGNLLLGADSRTVVVANETELGDGLNPLALNLSSSTPTLIVGGDMAGCYLEGAHTQFSASDTAYVGVDWNVCPLPLGKNCSGYLTDPCFPVPCGKHGVCVPAGEEYSCNCYTRYSGETCSEDNGPLCNRQENQCLYGGVCQEDHLGNSTHCACPTGFMGRRCEETVYDRCLNNPCLNNGTCVLNSFGDSFTCECAPGFTGPICATEENFCSSEPCLNHGICTPIRNGFICNCSHTGYRGDVCETNIDECVELPVLCQTGSTCIDLYGSFECACPPGFGGADCSINMDECISNPCLNSGICIDGINDFSCECQRGFAGRRCQINLDDCFENACPVNTICIDLVNNYECRCPPGFTGVAPNCEELNNCDPNPCLNGASCFNNSNPYTCICQPGFTGLTCETNIDDCQGVYCANGGTCRDAVRNYTCECPEGFTGTLCDHIQNECAGNVCVHAYNCTDLNGDYFCACEPGWSGKNCDQDVNECDPSPCLNNGTCEDYINTFVCNCLPGFQGERCEMNINDCAENPCQNGGSCEDGIGNYTCVCPEAFMGRHCEQPFDACAMTSCLNGASCVPRLGQRSHYCECLSGFEGLECENNINDCQNVECSDGMVCFDLVNDYECRCPEGFSGNNCSINIDECQNEPCLNGGTCHDGIANYTCICPSGYTGQNCSEDVDECITLSPCVNGICVNTNGSYECYCRPGFSGDNCSLEFDECLYRPCKNNGTCINMINSYQCQCPDGFAGTDCEIDIDECESQPCQNGATCIDGIATFTCQCLPGFTDTLCATNIDECESNPCLNYGTCTDGINMFECNCSDTGFKGLFCEINIDDCDPDLCQHESNCTDLVKDYNCTCYDGYAGKNCEEDVLECASNPCQHGGQCYEFSNLTLYEIGFFDFPFSYDNAGGFVCNCQPGFTGDFCEVNIDECASNPCHYGTCVDGINSYECLCQPGYEGVHCETEIDECQRFTPCVYGSCIDKVADYECQCEAEYGGKNCSVLLQGCREVECYNGGTCVALLIDERVHEFRCDCQAGFTGRNCELITTMSMNGNAHLVLDSQMAEGYELSFRFRTTLANVILAVGQGLNDYYTLVLHQGKLRLHSSILSRYNGVFTGSSLNNGTWQMVSVKMNATHSILAANNDTTQREHMSSHAPSSSLFNNTYLGGVTSNLRILVPEPPFTGCMQDVILNEVEVIPAGVPHSAKINVTEGCQRVPQCDPNPCHNEGQCTDLWTSFKCTCKRPYLGDTCRMSFTPATFNNEDIRDSLAAVEIPPQDQANFRRRVDISMLVQTRQNSGLIFYLGQLLDSANQLGSESDSDSYLLAELVNGRVMIKIRLGSTEEVFETDGPYMADGDSHLLHVERNEDQILISVDEKTSLNATLDYNGDLLAQILYLGGVPVEASNRVKRQLGVSIVSPEETNKNFKGVLQDIRIVGGNETLYVELYPLEIIPDENFSLDGSSIPATHLHNVLSGVVSDDTCAVSPCLEGGNCTVTFNDFHCSCPTGFKGKVCDELEYCAMYQCPEGGHCQNLIDGYECLANATFDGNERSLYYETRLTNASTFRELSTMYRSKVGGVLITASVQEGTVWVGVDTDMVVVQQVNGSTKTTHFSNHNILDGQWHHLSVIFDPSGLQVLLDNITLLNNDLDDSIIVDFDVIVRRGGVNVGSLPEGLKLRTDVRLDVENARGSNTSAEPQSIAPYFRGCMSDTRIGNLLLPFFSPGELINNSAANVFDKISDIEVDYGCQVCFQEECQNSGKCLDPNNTFECTCPAGFKGGLCQINIDECQFNKCENDAICVDAINEYKCDCQPGYEGQYCEFEIDECRSNPCQNGGTCFDEIAAFRCICPEDYIGAACDELKIKNCSNNQCQNGATCIDIQNHQTGVADNYTCECPFFFGGYNCENAKDFCKINNVKCANGTCELTYEGEGWKCQCEEGFTGKFCRTPTNECLPNPCANGGTCEDRHRAFKCHCKEGWRGENCTNNVNECEEMPGLCHTGECIDVDGGYFCECDQKHCGQHCTLLNPCIEENINCTQGQCVKICDEITNETEPKCQCFDGWQGDFCDQEVSTLTTISIIIGVVVSLMVVVAAVGLIIFFMMAKKKRETSGTYSPSKQEFYSPRVEMGNIMKPPPEERLI